MIRVRCCTSTLIDLDPAALTLHLGQTPRNALLAAVILLVAVIARSASRGLRQTRRDPVRWFPAPVRATTRARASGRCEYLRLLGRCRRPAQETDHFIPWARGGATDQANAVASCRRHNQRKGARTPSLTDAVGLWWRRRTYFPPGVPRWPGHRYRTLTPFHGRTTR